MKIKIFCVMFCVLLLAGGCSTGGGGMPGSGSQEVPPKQTVTELDSVRTDSIEKQQYEYTVEEFDAGSGVYVSPAGKEMPYHINGIIGVPEGSGPFPLVLITHGSHSNDNENLRFDTGYRYLVEALAEQGIVAVSMDMSKAYTWKYGDNDDREKSQYLALEHLDALIKAQKGEENAYPVELEGKIDLTKIGLAGHSRGGETIFDIAGDMRGKGFPVEALLCIAPTFLFTDREWPEGKAALVIPEYDGDVIDLDGFALYDVLGEKTEGEHLAVFLKKANHNYFNSNIQRNDADMVASDRDVSDQLPRERQEAFLRAFASDYFYCALQEERSLLAPGMAQPDRMYGEEITVLLRTPNNRPVFSAGDDGAYTAENMIAETKVDAWFFKLDELLADTITHGEEGQQTRTLLKADWDSIPASIRFQPSVKDWKDFNSLVLDFVVDAADEKNWEFEYQSFSLRLKDRSGNTAAVKLPGDLQALKRAPGKMDSTPLIDETIYFWSIRTPLSSLILPLSSFEGVNLSEIESVELIFEDTARGSLLIESLRLQ